jgi:rRNA maturation protein Nop10
MEMPTRKECLECKTHTFRDSCGNCGSEELRPVMPGRFERTQTRRSLNALLRTEPGLAEPALRGWGRT